MNILQIIDSRTHTNSELRHILVTHGEQVARLCLDVAQRHPELQLDTNFLYEASLLHDIGVHLCNAPGIHCYGAAPYIAHGYLGRNLLTVLNLPRHALVAERHTGAGLSLQHIIENHLPLPHREMLPVSLEEQLICYADKFFSKSKLDKQYSIEQIIAQLEQHDSHSVDRFLSWHKLFS